MLLEECPDGALTFILGHHDSKHYKSLAAMVVIGKNASADPNYWEKMNLVLMAATCGTVSGSELNGRRFLILHAFLEMISGVGSFQEQFPIYCGDISSRVMRVLELLKERVPEQFHCQDDFGSHPLHIAVRNKHASTYESTRDTSSLVIEYLVKEYRKSAGSPDEQGRLPLHVAVENALPCIDLLIQAEPRALVTRCLVTRMYPFQLAAYGLATREEYCTSTDKQIIAAVETTFNLLRNSPSTARVLAARREPWMENPIYIDIQLNKKDILLYKLKIAELEARNYKLERALEPLKKSHH